MRTEQIKQLFSDITVWKRGAERAPHKPLLLLYALAKCSRGEPRLVEYQEIDTQLRKLLTEFGPSRKVHHPEYPFWRLHNDGVWELQGITPPTSRQSNTYLLRSDLMKVNPSGGLSKPIYDECRRNPALLNSIASEI